MDANIKTPQDALEWLERRIHEEAKVNGEMTNENAIQLGFIQNMLAKFPRRNCDVCTVKELNVRYNKFCYAHRAPENGCGGCPLNSEPCCELAWAQLPYEKGGNDER